MIEELDVGDADELDSIILSLLSEDVLDIVVVEEDIESVDNFGSECEWKDDDDDDEGDDDDNDDVEDARDEDGTSELEEEVNREEDDSDEVELKVEESCEWNSLVLESVVEFVVEVVEETVEFVELELSVREFSKVDKLGVTMDVILCFVTELEVCEDEEDDDNDERRVVLVEPSKVVEDEVELDIILPL